MDRRNFLQTTGAAMTALSLAGGRSFAAHHEVFKIGMCDWNVRSPEGNGMAGRVEALKYAAEAGIKGVQASVATSPDNVPLRGQKGIEAYQKAMDETGVQVCSIAAGSILNSIPLATEPESAVYVIEAVEAAAALGAKNVLLAFFGRGDLRYRDHRGNLVQTRSNPNEFLLDQRGVSRVVNVLRQIAPRAEELGVALGLENTITAAQNVEIIERAGSDIVQVYYDIGNSTSNGYDVPNEIRMLGSDRICEIHLKDNGRDARYFGHENSEVDWPGVADALKAIGYDKWYTIEESGRDGHFVEDTKKSIEFAKNLLA